MIEYEKTKEMLDKWRQHDQENGYYKGVPNYPTNTKFVGRVHEIVEEQQVKIIMNVLQGKQSRINGLDILKKVVSEYLDGTEYTVEEVIEIMRTK
ncbi:hypothetical protein L8C07_05490 [Paenibacillus sp. CMAA1739]|uniref:hypothetical protein n=1 Tax=Paenibacillus ottowii TaxID=2315729 RepID=UPI002DB6C98C|nr:hypothetical protein [Paenibacillus sp. CMAA1739]MEC4565391.1 hypothetical protein [Paenibacillus sp. CMAA1739]